MGRQAGCQSDEFHMACCWTKSTRHGEGIRFPRNGLTLHVLVPVPKKGDLSCCDNWQGITLLDVVGKVVAHILQDRLQQLIKKFCLNRNVEFERNTGALT